MILQALSTHNRLRVSTSPHDRNRQITFFIKYSKGRLEEIQAATQTIYTQAINKIRTTQITARVTPPPTMAQATFFQVRLLNILKKGSGGGLYMLPCLTGFISGLLFFMRLLNVNVINFVIVWGKPHDHTTRGMKSMFECELI